MKPGNRQETAVVLIPAERKVLGDERKAYRL
jgi:hypothetical protein